MQLRPQASERPQVRPQAKKVTNQVQGATATGITHIGGDAAHFNLEEFAYVGLVRVLVLVSVAV